MNLHDFYEAVERDPDIHGEYVAENADGEPVFVVQHFPTKLRTVITRQEILDAEWPVLESIITGRRDPNVLFHMTRVVGYFSRLNNWNASKIGELHDRQKGNYSINIIIPQDPNVVNNVESCQDGACKISFDC